MKNRARSCLTVAALRRSTIYQPLALIMAALMLPTLSWVSGGSQAGAFQAHADVPVVQGCLSTTNTIIQDYCTPAVGNRPLGVFYDDLRQLESDAVNSYLADHNLPASDAHLIYDYGRADLRNAVRGRIISILLGIIATPAASRTPHQQALYLWLQNLVWANEIADNTYAYNEFLSWQSNPCLFTLDPVIASQYGLSYSGLPFCGVSQSSVFNVTIPAPSYFKAFGLKKSYQAWADKLTCPVNASGVQDRTCNVAFQESTVDTQAVAGIAIAAGTVVTGSITGAVAASAYAAYSAWLTGLVTTTATGAASAASGDAGISALFLLSGTTFGSTAATLLSIGGTATIVAMAIAVGVTAGVKTFEYQQSIDELNDVKKQIAVATSTPPDLNGMSTDTTGLGLFKIQNSIMPSTLKANADGTLVDIPSTAPLPTHRLGTDLEFENVNDGSTYSTLSYKGWNGEAWSAQTWGGWFVQTCATGTKIDDSADGTCIQTDSLSADLHYVDSRFKNYLTGVSGLSGLSLFGLSRFSAARFGDKFFATRAQGRKLGELALEGCPASSWKGGVSGSTDKFLEACWTYVSTSIPVAASDGNDRRVLLTNSLSPTFTSSPVMAFGPGIPSTQSITVTGKPMPIVCITSSDLPANFKISVNPSNAMGINGCVNGFIGINGSVSIQLAFDGLSNAPVGVYSLTVKAVNLANGLVSATSQTFTINVSPQLAIISPDTMNVTSGVPASFTVVATGSPLPKLSVDGVDLGGMTFTDNGNGTATISGIDSNSLSPLECFTTDGNNHIPCAIVATNSQGVFRQPFRINLTPAPTAELVCNPDCSATFHAGAGNQVLLTSSGASTPVSWFFGDTLTPGPSPYPWLNLKDNGDGTAILSGAPPYETAGSSFTFYVRPVAQYSNQHFRQFTINVVHDSVFTSPNITAYDANPLSGASVAPQSKVHAMTVGNTASANSFTVSANTGTISLNTLLPRGLSFNSFGNTATISGTPMAGTGGQYMLKLSDDGGTAGTAGQQLILNVNESPKITTPATATLFARMPGLLTVSTSGFPSVSTHTIPANPLPPTDPSKGDGMYFTVTGLPASLHATNLSPIGFATGTLTIQGTPTDADLGPHQVQITAQNGVGMPAQQTLMLNIVGITGSAPASGTTCNGNYNGTFNGTITVSAGQNCAFYSGGVTGNIVVNGGYVALANTTVSGNMTVQGGSGFSIGPGTTINGNLSIAQAASGSSASSICQAKLGGNVAVSNNGIPINIGAPQAFCYGNSFGGNLTVQGNTAPVAVNDNTIVKNLSCSGNASITGSANAAAKKTGQCAGF